MIEIPEIKAHYHVEVVEGEGVFFLSEYGSNIFQGKIFELIVQQIDGKKSVSDISSILEDKLPLEEIYYGIFSLEKGGYLIDANGENSIEQSAFWNLIGRSAQSVEADLNQVLVEVWTVPGLTLPPYKELFANSGLKLAKEGNVILALTDDYLNKDLLELNRQAVKQGKALFPVKVKGGETWIGPIIIPGENGCLDCIASRLKGKRSMENYLQVKGMLQNGEVVSKIQTPQTLGTALNLAVMHLSTFVGTRTHPYLTREMVSIDQISLMSAHHPVTRRAQCKTCGDPQILLQQMSSPVNIDQVPKTVAQDGGHRSSSPDETFNKYKHHISPITGVVNYLNPGFHSGGEDHFSFVTGHNFAISAKNIFNLNRNIRVMSGGKGATAIQAKTSALCEALERFSGVYQGEEPFITASLEELGPRGIHPNDCMLYSDLQYQNRLQWNALGSGFNSVPIQFDPKAKINWTPVWSLTHGVQKYLPSMYLFYDSPTKEEQAYCWADSNGNAAGANREEAILQGFFELVERDAIAIWWYNMLQKPWVDVHSFNLPVVGIMDDRFRKMGKEFWVLDITSDLGIPVFAAISRNTNHPREELIFGFGAHFDPKIALSRALTEMNQFLPWVEGVRYDPASCDVITANWFNFATLESQHYLKPLFGPGKTLNHYFDQSHPNSITEDVLRCKQIVEGLGMEMLVQDQTRPDVGLPVVKVIVPGLRHFWARFAPGRLYDVPVKMGWRTSPIQETELNQIPMFV